MSVLPKPYFHDEGCFREARANRIGPSCRHCGSKGDKSIYDLAKTRIGLKKSGSSRKQFTVRVSTVFEASHNPL